MAKKLTEGQGELFDFAEILKITPEDQSPVEEFMKEQGRKVGGQIGDIIFGRASKLIRTKSKAMNIDLEAEAAKHDMEVEDLIMDLDDFYMVVGDLLNAFVDGLEEQTPMPIR